MDRALVLGASGFIGTRLVRRLASQGMAVTALDLAPPRERLDGVDYVSADVRRPLDPELGRGLSRIYNLAAVHRTPGHPPHEYYETNVWGAFHATALAELGEHPSLGGPVRIMSGRFGPYIKHGDINANVPRGRDPASVSLEEAVALLAEREAKGPGKKPARKAKATPGKTPAKKAPAKKPAAKKTTARKAAGKKA